MLALFQATRALAPDDHYLELGVGDQVAPLVCARAAGFQRRSAYEGVSFVDAEFRSHQDLRDVHWYSERPVGQRAGCVVANHPWPSDLFNAQLMSAHVALGGHLLLTTDASQPAVDRFQEVMEQQDFCLIHAANYPWNAHLLPSRYAKPGTIQQFFWYFRGLDGIIASASSADADPDSFRVL